MNLLKKNIILCVVLCVLPIASVFSEQEVVRLSRFVSVYDVEGLSDDYSYRMKGGQPDFGNAKVVHENLALIGVGTGVIVTKEGLILSNAHVTNAYKQAEISESTDEEGKVIFGSDKKPLKRIVVNLTPSYLFVGTQKSDENRAYLRYAAKVLYEDDTFEEGTKDRAVLAITNSVTEDSEGLPIVGKKLIPSELNLDYAEFGNVFSFFPKEESEKMQGEGQSVSLTGFYDEAISDGYVVIDGEFLSYQNGEVSKVFHSCYVPGGSSGAGLFCDGKLVAINTWDYSENFSRPMAIAQPVVWFFEPILKVSWYFDDVQIPSIPLEWINDDFSDVSGKKDAIVEFVLKKGSNNAIPVTSGTLIAFLSDLTVSDVLNYEKVSAQLDEAWEVVRLLGFYSVEEVIERTGKSAKYVERLKNVETTEDLKRIVNGPAQKYFQMWLEKGFVYDKEAVVNKDGRIAITLPKTLSLNLVYLGDDGSVQGSWTLNLDKDYIQGTYVLNVK